MAPRGKNFAVVYYHFYSSQEKNTFSGSSLNPSVEKLVGTLRPGAAFNAGQFP
jgi:hypothetical protein